MAYYYTQTTLFALPIYILASNQGLMYVSTDEQTDEQFFSYIKTKFNLEQAECERAVEQLEPYVKQLKQFELGQPIDHSQLSYDLRGTMFQKSVWEALLTIPYGETTTYGAIASQIGNVKAVRAVGRAIGANPILLFVPCHRVIGKDGSLTGFSSGLALKAQWLDFENKHRLKGTNDC